MLDRIIKLMLWPVPKRLKRATGHRLIRFGLDRIHGHMAKMDPVERNQFLRSWYHGMVYISEKHINLPLGIICARDMLRDRLTAKDTMLIEDLLEIAIAHEVSVN